MADQPLFESHKTATGRKRFKRYFTGHDNGQPGKGSWRRDTEVSEEQFANNWCQTFGHRPVDGVCQTCGAKFTIEAVLNTQRRE